MDAIKLDMKAVDEVDFTFSLFVLVTQCMQVSNPSLSSFVLSVQLHPNLSELMDSINHVSDLPPDHASRAKVQSWLVQLNQMKAHEVGFIIKY